MYTYVCVSNGLTRSSQCSYAIVCYCCLLLILLLFDSCKEVETETFHSSSLWTLAALPVAILVGVPERRTPLPILAAGGGVNPVATVKENLLSQE